MQDEQAMVRTTGAGHDGAGMRRMRTARRGLIGWAIALLAGIGALPAAAETLVAGPGGQPLSLTQALALAKDGDTIQVLPGEYKGEVAVVMQKKLTIRGVGSRGQRPVLLADGQSAEGKAILVIRDGDIEIENLEFRGARVPDGNGAGIRFEKGRLVVRDCAFIDNEHGIITANFTDAELLIDRSEFARAPQIVGGLNHLLYIGRIAKATIQGSRFHRGFEGHLIKSRARQTTLAYNMIRDTGDGQASYEVDLPSGGEALLIGNVIGQSPRTQNPVLIAYGAEGRVWERNSLVLAHNTLISENWRPAWFLRVFGDRVPGTEPVIAINNLVVGGGIFRLGASGEFDGNYPAMLGMLHDVTTGAFELPPDSIWRGRGIDPRNVRGRDLAPRAEFEWPVGMREIPRDRARWSPGAYQR